jgi:hypothetical protein
MSLVWYPCGYWSCGGSDSTPPPTGSWRIEIEDIAVLSVNPLSNGQPIQAYNTYCRDSAVSYNTALLGSSSYSGYTKKCVDIRPNQFTDNGGGGSCPITKYYYIFGADNNVQEAVCATGEDLPNQCNSYNNNPSVCTSNNQIACVNSIIPSHNAVYVMKSDCTIGPFAGVASNYYECRDGSNKSREKGVTVKVGTVKGSVCKRN